MAGDNSRSGRVPELDLLRFVAALAVMLFHYVSWEHQDTLLRLGWLGVPLFFQISGFVILWSATGSSATQFVASRAGRLYPTFWACCTATALLKLDSVTWPQYAANMTLGHFLVGIESINLVYWTLFYYEMRFYFLVGLLLVCRQLPNIERWVLAWLAASFVPALTPLTMGDAGQLFVSGMLLFLIWRDGASPLRIGAFLVAALSTTLHQGSDAVVAGYGVPGWNQSAAITMLGIHAVMLGVALRVWRLRGNFYVLGSLTYPLYLIHGPLGNALWPLIDAPAWLKVTVASLVSLAVSMLLAAWLERRACAALTRWLRARLDALANAAGLGRVLSAPPGAALAVAADAVAAAHGRRAGN